MSDQRLECPSCGGRTYTVSVLAAVGPTDYLGISCAECEEHVAKTAVENHTPELDEQIAAVYE